MHEYEVIHHPEAKPLMKKYTIKPGDTLGSIAKRFYNDSSKYTAIAEANNISDPNKIQMGQELILPGLEDRKDFLARAKAALKV